MSGSPVPGLKTDAERDFRQTVQPVGQLQQGLVVENTPRIALEQALGLG